MAHYLDELSEFLAATRFADLPVSVVAHSKVVIADTIAAIAAGAQEPEVQTLTASQAGGSTGPATVIGAGRMAEPQDILKHIEKIASKINET